jgi:hypothetical protein
MIPFFSLSLLMIYLFVITILSTIPILFRTYRPLDVEISLLLFYISLQTLYTILPLNQFSFAIVIS